MYGIPIIIDVSAVSDGNLEAISDFFCGSSHVIPKHNQVRPLLQIGLQLPVTK